MELSTFLWIILIINGLLALVWATKTFINIAIKLALFIISLGSLYFILRVL